MIDQLIKLVQQNAGDSITTNSAIPPQFKGEAVKEAGQEIFNGLQDQAKQGNIQGLMGLLKSGGGTGSLAGNPIVTQIISGLAGKFASRFGIPQQTAQQVASTLVPKVISQLVSKTNDPNDKDFDIQDMIKNFGGSGGLGGMIGGFFK